MRRMLLTLAAFAAIGLASGTAFAGGGHRGYGGGPRYFGPYGGYGPYAYGNAYGYGGYGYRSDPYLDALRRLQAKYSTYRYYTHPRSTYNSPPYPYDYWGW
jgi:hypothetical protein